MRIISLHVFKWADENSLFLCSAYDLSFVSWYQRPFYKETVNFGARTASKYLPLHSAAPHRAAPSQFTCHKPKRDATSKCKKTDSPSPHSPTTPTPKEWPSCCCKKCPWSSPPNTRPPCSPKFKVTLG